MECSKEEASGRLPLPAATSVRTALGSRSAASSCSSSTTTTTAKSSSPSSISPPPRSPSSLLSVPMPNGHGHRPSLTIPSASFDPKSPSSASSSSPITSLPAYAFHLPGRPRSPSRPPSPNPGTMPPTEASPLLSGNTSHGTAARREPSTWESMVFLATTGWVLNLLLIFVPLSFASHFAGWDTSLVFVFSFLAIVPLAKLLGDATEQVALKLGDTLGGLLNASFGNAVELIVGVVALAQGQLRIVQTSMLGSILSNLLLVLGMSFFAGGIRYSESLFQQTAAQASASVMTLSCITLIIPAAYHAAFTSGPPGDGSASESGLLVISRGTAILLLVIYGAYLFFQLKTHAHLFEAVKEEEEEEEEARMNVWTACAALLVITIVTSFCADYLVGTIDEIAQRWSLPKTFIGLILLPLVANAAEHVTSVWMAYKGKMELAIAVSVGSSIQIAVCLVPLLVVLGWIMHKDLTLFFSNFETISLFVSVLLVNLLVQDGKSNWLEGAMLMTLYIVIALAYFVTA